MGKQGEGQPLEIKKKTILECGVMFVYIIYINKYKRDNREM